MSVDAQRYAAVLATAQAAGAAPPGIDPAAFRDALLEDTYEVLADLALVEAAVAVTPACGSDVTAMVWPGTPVLSIAASSTAQEALDVLQGLLDVGASEAAVVAADAPDVPQLVLAKLFRALGSAQVAVTPAEGGGLVALASRLPVPDWVTKAEVGLDSPDALDRLAAAAPSASMLSVCPGWRRLRRPVDVGRLDPGLEGWEATRLLLSGHRVRGALTASPEV